VFSLKERDDHEQNVQQFLDQLSVALIKFAPFDAIDELLDLGRISVRLWASRLAEASLFCERLPEVVARYAHRTDRLNEAFSSIGFALGGRPGAKAATKLGMQTVTFITTPL
jgi:hypothetical protein